jgi:3-dehydroquinate synthase
LLRTLREERTASKSNIRQKGIDMEKIRVELAERSYNIYIGNGTLEGIGERLGLFDLSPKIAMVSNPTVFSLYGNRVSDSIQKAGFDLLTITIPDGEEFKDLTWLQHMYDELLGHGLDRSSALLALGGGVIGDITGFAASTYMRGIPYVQIPTTLLAQVDSSVGGKTGVNHKLGKNMIGTFWQPRIVWIDTDTLKTLPKRELLAGLAEVIKYGVIRDEELFMFLERNRDSILNLNEDALAHIIKRSCEIKADVVSKDERESGLRAILNYGHTVGHAIETATGYTQFLHGEAVAIGMYCEARLSQILGIIDSGHVKRIEALIKAYGLPCTMPPDILIDALISSMKLDKKAIAGELKFVLPEKIGKVIIQKGVEEKAVRDSLYS